MSIIRRMSALVFREIEGDLFAAPKTYSLAHCVAADLKMGAGIAVKFRDTYGQIDELQKQGVKAGGVAVLSDESRFIYYLISKNDTYKKPTYKDLYLSLHAMKNHMVGRQFERFICDRNRHNVLLCYYIRFLFLFFFSNFSNRTTLHIWLFHELDAV